MMLRMVESVKSDPNGRFCHQNICFEGGGPGFRQQLNNFSNQTKVCLNSPLTSGLDSYRFCKRVALGQPIQKWKYRPDFDFPYDTTSPITPIHLIWPTRDNVQTWSLLINLIPAGTPNSNGLKVGFHSSFLQQEQERKKSINLSD